MKPYQIVELDLAPHVGLLAGIGQGSNGARPGAGDGSVSGRGDVHGHGEVGVEARATMDEPARLPNVFAGCSAVPAVID